MSNKKILAVTGITRCGSTMMMRMLHRGGMEVLADTHTGYEDARMAALPTAWMWLEEARGKAVKLLDIHRFTPPRGISETGRDFIFILMTRNQKQQAKSIAKMLRLVDGTAVNRKGVMRLRDSIRRDMHETVSLIGMRGPMITVSFERTLSHPLLTAQKVAEFAGEFGFNLDPNRMAEAVISRSAKCYDGLLELQLMEDAR